MSKRNVSLFCLCSLMMMTSVVSAQSPTVNARPKVTKVNPSSTNVARQIEQPRSLVPTRLVVSYEVEVVFTASVSPIKPVHNGVKLSAEGASATVTSIGPHGYYTFPATSLNRPTAFAVIELPPNPDGLVFDVFCTQKNGRGRVGLFHVYDTKQSRLVLAAHHKSSDPDVVSGAFAAGATTGARWLRIFKKTSSSDNSSWDLFGCHIKGWRSKKVYKTVNAGDKA